MGEKYIFPEDVLKRDITKKITTHFNTVIHSPKLWLTLIIPPIAVIIIGLAVFAGMEIIGAAGGASPVYVALAVTAMDFAGASVKLQENKRGRG